MSFSINTNITSLQAQNYLRTTSDFQAKTLNRVTSGLRIVSSGDDAAGLAVANGYRSDQSVLTQGVRNANDGLSQLQIVDGGMTNISALLDRARTLATQSASGTFTGDRGVLNSEFTNVVSEINRQAQAIGLDSGGAFAKSLSVFIGGGRTNNGVDAITNGSVDVNLSTSTVDAKSLGLEGVKASGVAGTDIGTGGGNTSLTSILANAVNTGSEATSNYTTFTVKGPGFDGAGVKLSVNTQNMGSTGDLATAVNAAITQAGLGGTQQSTALRNAGITASITTDSTGKQQLSFSSGTTAFQVQAGDRFANALMGNFEQNASVSGTASYGAIDMSTNHSLSFKFDASAAVISVDMGTSATTSKSDIVSKLNADGGFSASATASLSGNEIVIRSNNNTSASKVTVVDNATSKAVGLTTSADVVGNAATASTGASLTNTVQGATATGGIQNLVGTDTNAAGLTIDGTNNSMVLTVGGVSATLTLDPTNPAAQTNMQIAADINAKIAAAGGGKTFENASAVKASVDSTNHIVLTAGQAGSAVAVGASTVAGLATGATSAASLTFTASDSITLRFQGAGMSAPVDIALAPITAGTTTTAQAITDLQSRIGSNSQLAAAGITVTTAESGKGLTFTSSNGAQFEVQATGDSTNKLGLGSFMAGNASEFDYTGRSATSAYVPSAVTTSNTATFEISLNGAAPSKQIVVQLGSATGDTSVTDAKAAKLTGSATEVTATLGGNLVVDIGGTKVTVAITTGETAAQSIGKLNADATFSALATAGLDATGTKLVLTSRATGTSSSVTIDSTTDASVLTALGVASNATAHGDNASKANIEQQINAQIATDASLVKAGMQAVTDSVGHGGDNLGNIRLESANSTNFRLNTFGGEVGFGFGTSGAAFTGNAASNAPAVKSSFDSNGASATATMNYSDMQFASDKQVVTVTANDASGGKHSIGITLQNAGTDRNAQTVDAALTAINTALQQSNDSTLKQIVAVKEQTATGSGIKFISSLSTFQVDAGGTPGGTGLTPPTGNVTSAAMLGTGSASTIGDQDSARSVVSALANAVSTLGKAQAVVGRGQNQFNYAVNLAQSQLTNLAASESRIRDADLASEAANMTKAQIMLQAGIAALAQANSAPQQVLTLLRG